MFKLNPTVLLVILIGIGFQTAFSQSITLNIIVAVVGLLYLLLQRVSGKVIVIMLLVAVPLALSLIHISEPTRRTPISYAVFCLKKKKRK